MEWFSIFVHKVVPRVGKRTKPGLVVGHNKIGCLRGYIFLWIHIIDEAYEFI